MCIFAGETCLHLAARLDDKYTFYFLLFSFEVNVNVTVRNFELPF